MEKHFFDVNSRWVNIHKLNEIITNIYAIFENGGISPSEKIYWGRPVQNKEDLPLLQEIGYVAFVISEMKMYVFNGIEYKPLEVELEFATVEDIDSLFK